MDPEAPFLVVTFLLDHTAGARMLGEQSCLLAFLHIGPGVLLALDPLPGLAPAEPFVDALKGPVFSFLGQRIPRMGQVQAGICFFWNFPLPGKG